MTYSVPYTHLPKSELYPGLLYTKSELEHFLSLIFKDINNYENELLKSPNDENVLSLLSDARLWTKALLSRLLMMHSKFPNIAENDADEEEEVCTKEDCRACCCSC